jgi:hypothetical protein
LYSLYDALVSINVPSDKARAVVDAMEHDMGTTLATKQDLEVQRLATKQDLEAQSYATKKDLEIHRLATKQDLEILRRDMENRFALTDQKIDTLELRLTIKLGSMMVVGFGLTIAALRLWG